MNTRMRWHWLAVALASLPSILSAQHIAIADYSAITPASQPYAITEGPDRAVWFTEWSGNNIGRVTAAGALNEYAVPTADSEPAGIAAGPDGALWFTESLGNKIGRITTGGTITEYSLPTAQSLPDGITSGPDGALWFTETNRIGRITTAGAITEYSLPSQGSYPDQITTGPDGALWFTESALGIGRITVTGAITEYPVTGNTVFPSGITAGPDGALWFTTLDGNTIGRITTAGAITQYPVPTANSRPYGIASGPDGALWFTEESGNKLGRITTAGAITEYAMPRAGSGPWGITSGPSHALWTTEVYGNRIGEAVFVTAGLGVSPAVASFGTSLTFNGSAFTPNETVSIYEFGIGSAVLASARADASGAFTAAAANPAAQHGPRIFFGVGQSSQKLGAARLSVTPLLNLNPDSGTAGSTVVAVGYGFAALETVGIEWPGQRELLTEALASTAGGFSANITIPADASPGVYTVTALGFASGAQATTSFTVQ